VGCRAHLSLARVNEGRVRCEDCTQQWQRDRVVARAQLVERVAQALRGGTSPSGIARQLGVGYATVRRIAIELRDQGALR